MKQYVCTPTTLDTIFRDYNDAIEDSAQMVFPGDEESMKAGKKYVAFCSAKNPTEPALYLQSSLAKKYLARYSASFVKPSRTSAIIPSLRSTPARHESLQTFQQGFWQAEAFADVAPLEVGVASRPFDWGEPKRGFTFFTDIFADTRKKYEKTKEEDTAQAIKQTLRAIRGAKEGFQLYNAVSSLEKFDARTISAYSTPKEVATTLSTLRRRKAARSSTKVTSEGFGLTNGINLLQKAEAVGRIYVRPPREHINYKTTPYNEAAHDPNGFLSRVPPNFWDKQREVMEEAYNRALDVAFGQDYDKFKSDKERGDFADKAREEARQKYLSQFTNAAAQERANYANGLQINRGFDLPNKSFSSLPSDPNHPDFISLDIESTGLKQSDSTTNVAAVRYKWNPFEQRYVIDNVFNRFYFAKGGAREWLYNSEGVAVSKYDESVVKLMRNNSAIKYAKYWDESQQKALLDFIGDARIVGHNITAFDLPHLFGKAEFASVASYFKNGVIDTVTLARAFRGRSRGINTLDVLFKETFGITMEQAGLPHHDALSDVKATAMLLQAWAFNKDRTRLNQSARWALSPNTVYTLDARTQLDQELSEIVVKDKGAIKLGDTSLDSLFQGGFSMPGTPNSEDEILTNEAKAASSEIKTLMAAVDRLVASNMTLNGAVRSWASTASETIAKNYNPILSEGYAEGGEDTAMQAFMQKTELGKSLKRYGFKSFGELEQYVTKDRNPNLQYDTVDKAYSILKEYFSAQTAKAESAAKEKLENIVASNTDYTAYVNLGLSDTLWSDVKSAVAMGPGEGRPYSELYKEVDTTRKQRKAERTEQKEREAEQRKQEKEQEKVQKAQAAEQKAQAAEQKALFSAYKGPEVPLTLDEQLALKQEPGWNTIVPVYNENGTWAGSIQYGEGHDISVSAARAFAANAPDLIKQAQGALAEQEKAQENWLTPGSEYRKRHYDTLKYIDKSVASMDKEEAYLEDIEPVKSFTEALKDSTSALKNMSGAIVSAFGGNWFTGEAYRTTAVTQFNGLMQDASGLFQGPLKLLKAPVASFAQAVSMAKQSEWDANMVNKETGLGLLDKSANALLGVGGAMFTIPGLQAPGAIIAGLGGLGKLGGGVSQVIGQRNVRREQSGFEALRSGVSALSGVAELIAIPFKVASASVSTFSTSLFRLSKDMLGWFAALSHSMVGSRTGPSIYDDLTPEQKAAYTAAADSSLGVNLLAFRNEQLGKVSDILSGQVNDRWIAGLGVLGGAELYSNPYASPQTLNTIIEPMYEQWAKDPTANSGWARDAGVLDLFTGWQNIPAKLREGHTISDVFNVDYLKTIGAATPGSETIIKKTELGAKQQQREANREQALIGISDTVEPLTGGLYNIKTNFFNDFNDMLKGNTSPLQVLDNLLSSVIDLVGGGGKSFLSDKGDWGKGLLEQGLFFVEGIEEGLKSLGSWLVDTGVKMAFGFMNTLAPWIDKLFERINSIHFDPLSLSFKTSDDKAMKQYEKDKLVYANKAIEYNTWETQELGSIDKWFTEEIKKKGISGWGDKKSILEYLNNTHPEFSDLHKQEYMYINYTKGLGYTPEEAREQLRKDFGSEYILPEKPVEPTKPAENFTEWTQQHTTEEIEGAVTSALQRMFEDIHITHDITVWLKGKGLDVEPVNHLTKTSSSGHAVFDSDLNVKAVDE